MSEVSAVLYDPARDIRVEVAIPWTGSDEGLEFMWNEGNYACDCNRRLFMCRALGEPEPETDTCGHTIKLERLLFDGRKVEGLP